MYTGQYFDVSTPTHNQKPSFETDPKSYVNV